MMIEEVEINVVISKEEGVSFLIISAVMQVVVAVTAVMMMSTIIERIVFIHQLVRGELGIIDKNYQRTIIVIVAAALSARARVDEEHALPFENANKHILPQLILLLASVQ